jgi:hypothetical protein
VVDPNMKLPKLSVAAGAVGGATIRAAASVAHILCSVVGGPPGTQTDAVEALRVYSEAAVGGGAQQKFSADHARVYSSVDGLRGGASMPTYELLPALQKEVLDCAAALQVWSLHSLRSNALHVPFLHLDEQLKPGVLERGQLYLFNTILPPAIALTDCTMVAVTGVCAQPGARSERLRA